MWFVDFKKKGAKAICALVVCFQVPPEQFCDIIWAGDLHYKDHQCDFLAAYVAVCYTHQVCINWRRHNFCRKET